MHKRFSTATVRLRSGIKVDFSSARKEHYPKPGHLPVVSMGSLRGDLFRRDFTINAMAISLNSGRLIDYFGGAVDLKQGKIRILHNLSFKDDPTRILRGIRFEQRLGFTIEPKTLKLLKEAAGLKLLEEVHPHRLRDELILALKEASAIKEIKRIKELVGFGFLSRGFKLYAKDYEYIKSLGKEIVRFNKNYPGRRPLDTWLIYLIGLVNPLSYSKAKDFCVKFGLRKGEEKRILSYKSASRSFIGRLSAVGIKPSRIFALLEPLSYESIISLSAKSNNPVFKKNVADFLEIYNGMCVLVSGEDLHCLGLPPGPRYQEIFSEVLNAKLNGEVHSKEEELSLTRRLLGIGA